MRRDPYEGLTPEERQLLVERAARYARKTEGAIEETTEVVRFRRGDEVYAIPLAYLREIRALRRLCTIPGASPVVPAIFHHRGEILSAHDLSAFLHGSAAASRWQFCLIVDVGDRRVALLADELIGVLAITASQLSPLPVTLGERAQGFTGVVGEGVLVLRPGALFDLPSLCRAF